MMTQPYPHFEDRCEGALGETPRFPAFGALTDRLDVPWMMDASSGTERRQS